VERGQRVGLIKFGSRVDVLVPAEAVLRVKVGQRVKGGSSVLAAMAEAVLAPLSPAVNETMSASLLPEGDCL
jgi:phosphatidylserine decarboxylase